MNYNSIFKDEIISYINYKKSNGYSFESEIVKFKNFDKYLIENNIKEKRLTKDLVIAYIESHKLRSKTITLSVYASLIRQFALYLHRIEVDAYIIPINYYSTKRNFIPYIYTDNEIKSIFTIVKEKYSNNNIRKKKQVYLIFKLLFGTGMRIGEVLNLKCKNINYEKNSIKIEDTKNNCDRLIIISDDLIEELQKFNIEYNSDFEYFFENRIKTKYMVRDFYSIFRKIIFKAKIMHFDNGPRVHDIRHTFAVNSYRNAINKGLDINNFVVTLSVYMGHKRISSTYKYLHLTAEYYPNLKGKIENIITLEKDIDYEDL